MVFSTSWDRETLMRRMYHTRPVDVLLFQLKVCFRSDPIFGASESSVELLASLLTSIDKRIQWIKKGLELWSEPLVATRSFGEDESMTDTRERSIMMYDAELKACLAARDLLDVYRRSQMWPNVDEYIQRTAPDSIARWEVDQHGRLVLTAEEMAFLNVSTI